jgi:hypothetical protein
VKRRKNRKDKNEDTTRIRVFQAQPMEMLLSAQLISIEIEQCSREHGYKSQTTSFLRHPLLGPLPAPGALLFVFLSQ